MKSQSFDIGNIKQLKRLTDLDLDQFDFNNDNSNNENNDNNNIVADNIVNLILSYSKLNNSLFCY